MNFVGTRRSERTKSDDYLVKSKLMLKRFITFGMKKKYSFHCLGEPIVKKFIKGINYELVGLLNLK